MSNNRQATLYYFHDPMCSWCWGFRPTWLKLQEHLPQNIKVEYVLGGLAADNDQPMPQDMREMLQGTWRQIHRELGADFNFDFWTKNTPRRSTYPSYRAVIAAKQQGKELEMIYGIQQAYYQYALNPSDDAVLLQVAADIGLNGGLFKRALSSDKSQSLLNKHIAQAKSWMVSGYPSLVLQYVEAQDECSTSKLTRLPISLSYLSVKGMLEQIAQAQG